MRSPLDDVEGQVEVQNTGSKTAKYLTVVGSLVAVGFVAITTYQNASPAGSSASTTMFDNADLMFTGAYAGGRTEIPTYDALDDTAKSSLFELYADRFSRSVS